jgi:ABC-type Fe3+/spermidine/putrescine transport system ATPase subunit
LQFQARQQVKEGAVTAAIRPEAWTVVSAQGALFTGVLQKKAYLGSSLELTFDTELGSLFVVTSDLSHDWSLGMTLGLSLTGRGVSVVSQL